MTAARTPDAVHNCGVQHVAFFRNLNQGQRGKPGTSDLVDAFSDAGFPDAVAFQSNGTVLFDTDAPEDAVRDVLSSLAARGTYSDEVYARPLTFIERLVDRFST